ncbi:TetR/AcrR family transcriptional regulator [Microbacterium limosum]|uniref:TetR/AcrR family transcriptional regulator n=1 Tax=Microbacterium limosum TaxID=3079935 RepID=A0AAU0MGV4_9MICO|nr:TetR/AcrR family transcriptional regulator [Microbacterium sp. Y20]WOQ69252.1 TetR/AcrR family transcriptional regulator [Microbacterium sp. Y20]
MDGTPERQRLLGLVVDLILRDGVIDLSLSAIARAIGSNNRMLLYYFGSKQELIGEAALVAFDRFPRLRDMFDRLRDAGDLEERLIAAWDDLADPESRPYVRLFFQRFGIAMRDPDEWGDFIERVGREWVEEVDAVLRAEGFDGGDARAAATQIIALFRGLQFLLLSGVPADQLRDAYRLGIRPVLERAPGFSRR